MIHPYILGILWAIGTFTEGEGTRYFFLRHKDRYFLDVVKAGLGVTAAIHTVTEKGRVQYRLKVHGYDILREMERLGWQPRWSEQRGYPSIAEHRDFVRVYLEIHAAVDTIIIRKKSRPPHENPRLRIYGNNVFLAELTEVLVAQVETGVKKVQKTTDIAPTSGILYYQSTAELESIYAWLCRPGTEFLHRGFQEEFREVLVQFRR